MEHDHWQTLPKSHPALYSARVVFVGFLMALGASAAISASTFGLLMIWLAQFPELPDFGGNGLLWVTTTIMMVDLAGISLLLIMFYCMMLPVWCSMFFARRGRLPDTWFVVAILLVIEVVLLGLLYWGSGLQLLLISIGPVVVATGISASFFLHFIAGRISSEN